VPELAKEALDEVVLAIESLGEARLSFVLWLARDVARGTLAFDQRPEPISVIRLVGQDDDVRPDAIGQPVGDLACRSLAVKPSRTRSPCASTSAWTLIVIPPRQKLRQ
jgi:hypothetical protein